MNGPKGYSSLVKSIGDLGPTTLAFLLVAYMIWWGSTQGESLLTTIKQEIREQTKLLREHNDIKHLENERQERILEELTESIKTLAELRAGELK